MAAKDRGGTKPIQRAVSWVQGADVEVGAQYDSLPIGLVRALRNDLGLTSVELGQRLDIKQASVSALEKSERIGRIQIDTLSRALHALGYRLSYTAIPLKSSSD